MIDRTDATEVIARILPDCSDKPAILYNKDGSQFRGIIWFYLEDRSTIYYPAEIVLHAHGGLCEFLQGYLINLQGYPTDEVVMDFALRKFQKDFQRKKVRISSICFGTEDQEFVGVDPWNRSNSPYRFDLIPE